MRAVGANSDFGEFIVEVVVSEASKFADSNAGLEKNFHDSRDTIIVATSIAKGTVFEFGENARGSEFDFGMTNFVSRVVVDEGFGFQEAEEGFDGIDFSGYGFGGVTILV